MQRATLWLFVSALSLGSCSCSANRADSPGPDAAPTPSPGPPSASQSAPAPLPAASQSAPAPLPAPSQSAPAPAPRRAYVVAAVGDSLTDARSHGGGFLEFVKERCPESRFDNFGKGGDMVNQMRRRFERDVLGAPAQENANRPAYTHVIVFGGVNDLYSDKTALRTVSLIEKDLSTMYAAARQRGSRVVAITVAPWGGFSKYYNGDRAETTRKLNAWILGRKEAGEVDHVIDAHALLLCGPLGKLCPEYAEPFRDGLHFGPKGHEKLGEALYREAFADCR